MQSSYFRSGPTDLPKDFTKATKSFKWKVFIAMFGLLAFFTIYFGLMYWFLSEAFNIFSYLRSGVDEPIYYFLAGLSLSVLGIFMFKSLFTFRKRTKNPYRQIVKEEEPELISFIYATADEVGAPRPNKVYVSDRVNASVSYDLSLINILFPSKKNLEIGMGLMNVINLSEFKAILAHEFGHFAQRSMLLGRYVYVAHQIAAQLVHKRDALDRGLAILSSIDIRISWIGWILSIIVWAIRSFIAVLFSIVAISERALSREMEYQADKVAVSVAGSDSIVLGLHKLQAADQGYHGAIAILDKLLKEEKAIEDLYALQHVYIEEMRKVLDDPAYGAIPENAFGENNRIFKSKHVNPPEMWSTHPADIDRENNAKEIYIASELDDRNTTILFSDAAAMRKEITSLLLKNAEVKFESKLSSEDAIAFLHKEMFRWRFLSNEYKGLYLNRSVFSSATSLESLYDIELDRSAEESLKLLYPDSMKEVILDYRELTLEIQALEVTLNEPRTAEKRKIYHRGDLIRKSRIPEILDSLNKEKEEVMSKLRTHDKMCRRVHLSLAESEGIMAAGYYKSLLATLQLTENFQNTLHFYNADLQLTLQVAFADGNVSDSELRAIVDSTSKLHKTMNAAVQRIAEIKDVPHVMLKELDVEKMEDLIGEFTFEYPDHQNIESWLNNYQGWFVKILWAVEKLHNIALDQLLSFETDLSNAAIENRALPAGFTSFEVPKIYEKKSGDEQAKTTLELSTWDKFHSGEGIVSVTARFVAAASIIILALYASYLRPDFTVYLQNSFDQTMIVSVDNKEYIVPANSYVTLSTGDVFEITTQTESGQFVEAIRPDIESGFRNYIYNIAGGSYLISYTINYGTFQNDGPKNIGTKSWTGTNAYYIFEEPDEEIYSTSSESRDAVLAADQISPSYVINAGVKEDEFSKILTAHLKWDTEGGLQAMQWMEAAAFSKNGKKELHARLKLYPNETTAHRSLMDVSSVEERAGMVGEYREKYELSSNPDFLYLSTRAMSKGEKRQKRFTKGFREHPDNEWLAYASGYEFAFNYEWKASKAAFEVVDFYSPLYAYACNHLARVSRMLDGPENVSFITGCKSTELMDKLRTGNGIDIENPYDMFFQDLSKGNIALAESGYKLLEDGEREAIGILLAASTGASEAFQDEMVQLGLTYASGGNFPALIGLRMKLDLSIEEALDAFIELDAMDEETSKVLRNYITFLHEGELKQAKEELVNIEYYTDRARFLVIGCVALGEDAPESWVREVMSILFFDERPYFKTTK